MNTQIFLVVIVMALAYVCSADVDCTTIDSCGDGTYTCDGDGCIITCSGLSSCENSLFTCTSTCSVDCTSRNACANSEFYFYSDTSLNCTHEEACGNSAYHEYNGTLAITCDADSSCEDMTLYMHGDDSYFTLSCEGSYACDHSECYCTDKNDCEKSSNYNMNCRSLDEWSKNKLLKGN